MRAKFLMAVIAASATMGACWGQNPGAARSSGCSADALPLLQSIWAEIRSMRVELLVDRRELQQVKLQDLERQLENVQSQEHQFQAEQSSRAQQAADIDSQLLQPNLDKATRDELEAQKADLLTAASSSQSAIAQNAISQRAARVRDLLAAQEQRMQELDRLARQLSAGAP